MTVEDGSWVARCTCPGTHDEDYLPCHLNMAPKSDKSIVPADAFDPEED